MLNYIVIIAGHGHASAAHGALLPTITIQHEINLPMQSLIGLLSHFIVIKAVNVLSSFRISLDFSAAVAYNYVDV